MEGMKEFLVMGGAAVGLVILGITSVLGIAVLEGFKSTNVSSVTLSNGTVVTGTGLGYSNATVTLFQTGIGVFGTFSSIIALVLVAKVVLGLIKGGFDSN